MIDPAFSLAISVHGAPGVFAVLAGSGLSRRAGIKTGWEILLGRHQRPPFVSGHLNGWPIPSRHGSTSIRDSSSASYRR